MPQLSATFLPTTVVEKKQVRFAPTATVNTRSVSHEDLNNSWYGEVDYRSFEEENRHTVGLIFCTGGDSSSLDPEHYSVLGLEQYAAGHRQMMTCRLKTLQHAAIVLEMYDVQRCSGIFDPEMVRRVSEWFSDEPVRRAQIRAAGSA